ncbi:hypothetical protein LWI29_022579 [Acer saccharum]|uniref:Uncharacterized protein n=1 Tax=Acer saccharum TaxID=4024 RepID=A0AA39S7Z6_ACESA|nr:hypothetical protein LWI29_022579 [Acer saccharum]
MGRVVGAILNCGQQLSRWNASNRKALRFDIKRVQDELRQVSLQTDLDRPNSSTINSWFPPVITVSSPHSSWPPLSPSTAILSPELSPRAAPIHVPQAAAPQLHSPVDSPPVDPMPLSSSSAADSPSASAAHLETPGLQQLTISAGPESTIPAAAIQSSTTGACPA